MVTAGGCARIAAFLDHDPAGRHAEALAREAFSHLYSIETLYPTRAGDDWNDVLLRRSSGGAIASIISSVWLHEGEA